MRGLICRVTAFVLCTTVGLSALAAPCAANEIAAKSGSKLTQLSPASRQLLASAPAAANKQQQPPAAATPTEPSSFFKTTRGKVTLALMGAGAAFTIWSINHDRKPVKSPIR